MMELQLWQVLARSGLAKVALEEEYSIANDIKLSMSRYRKIVTS